MLKKAITAIEVLTGGVYKYIEIPLKTSLLTLKLKATAGVQFDVPSMTAEGSLSIGVDFQTKAAQGPLVEAEVAPLVDLKKKKVLFPFFRSPCIWLSC